MDIYDHKINTVIYVQCKFFEKYKPEKNITCQLYMQKNVSDIFLYCLF